ncbi:chloride channel protein [Georgenia yuyongxinii]
MRLAALSWLVRLAVVTVLVGVGGGMSGMVVGLGLQALEHLAYGYSAGTFLSRVVGSAPWRRILALAVAGVVGAVGWWALRRWGRPVVSVQDSVQGARMSALVTLVNAGLQITMLVWPGMPVAAFALVAAGAFLASSMRAPFTALLLVVEFTDRGPALLPPVMIAIAGSVAVSQLVSRRWLSGVA